MTDSKTLLLATRGSDLALTQSGTIADALRALGANIELTIITTAGDRSAEQRFADIGPQGVFVREIEQALLDRRAQIAVHSCKDLPTSSPEELVIGAIPPRVDAHDVLLIRTDALDTGEPFAPITREAKVGTSSARRQAWLRHFRPDLQIEPLRGNVPTRIGHLRDGRYDAIVLAAAGLERLRGAEALLEPLLEAVTIYPLDAARFVPSPAQGALAVQCRADDKATLELLAQIDDAVSRACVEAERAALAGADGGCEIAFGAHCRHADDTWTIDCMLERSGQVQSVSVSATDPSALGNDAWQQLDRSFSAQ